MSLEYEPASESPLSRQPMQVTSSGDSEKEGEREGGEGEREGEGGGERESERERQREGERRREKERQGWSARERESDREGGARERQGVGRCLAHAGCQNPFPLLKVFRTENGSGQGQNLLAVTCLFVPTSFDSGKPETPHPKACAHTQNAP